MSIKFYGPAPCWILEHSTIRNGKVYRHEYLEHDDGRIDWRVKVVAVKQQDTKRPWEVEMDLAMEGMR